MSKNEGLFEAVEDLYARNFKSLKEYEDYFFNRFLVPQVVLRETIKRKLVGSFGSDLSSNLRKPNKTSIGTLVYLVCLFNFVLNILIGWKTPRVLYSADIIFHHWSSKGNEKYYQKLLPEFSQFSFMTLHTGRSYPRDVTNAGIINRAKRRYDPKTCVRVVANSWATFWLSLRLARTCEVNFILLSALLMRNLAKFEYESSDVKCSVLISAADNNFSALRHFTYKKNGVKNICLIQNGLRSGGAAYNHGDLYSTCDFYFGFGVKQIEIQKGLNCKKSFAVGSVLAQNRIEELEPNPDLRYDIVFPESISNHDSAYFNFEVYQAVLENLIIFSIRHKDITIYYRKRPKPLAGKRKRKLIKLYQKMRAAGILVDESLEVDSFSAINKARLVIFYQTTMGLEALAMEKRVLQVSYDNNLCPFGGKPMLSVLSVEGYEAFEAKILSLLSKRNTVAIREHYLQLSVDYMNQSRKRNPNKIIATEILPHLN